MSLDEMWLLTTSISASTQLATYIGIGLHSFNLIPNGAFENMSMIFSCCSAPFLRHDLQAVAMRSFHFGWSASSVAMWDKRSSCENSLSFVKSEFLMTQAVVTLTVYEKNMNRGNFGITEILFTHTFLHDLIVVLSFSIFLTRRNDRFFDHLWR